MWHLLQTKTTKRAYERSSLNELRTICLLGLPTNHARSHSLSLVSGYTIQITFKTVLFTVRVLALVRRWLATENCFERNQSDQNQSKTLRRTYLFLNFRSFILHHEYFIFCRSYIVLTYCLHCLSSPFISVK